MTTIASVIFGERQDPATALAPPLLWAIGPVSAAVPTQEIHTQAAVAIADLLAMPLGNLALAAWDRYQRVRVACEDTSAHPGRRHVVRLARHRITSEQHPTVDLDIGGRPVTLRQLTLLTEIEIDGAGLVVEQGRIVHVEAGTAKASATLLAGGMRLAHGSLNGVALTADWAAQPPNRVGT